MAKSKVADFMKAKEFLARLQDTIQFLPTEAEKRQAKERLAALVGFLGTLQDAVAAMPTTDDLRQINEALAWLQGLFSKAVANPVLAGLAPAPRSRKGRKGVQAGAEMDHAGARVDVDTFKALPAEEIRSRLADQARYSLSRIRGMAAVLGIGGAERLSRESLAHQVATKIANYRGYETLSGRSQN